MLINSVSKALNLLTLINDGGEDGYSLVELAAMTGQKVPTVFNLLSTLESEGFAARDAASRRYFIGERARELGVWRSLPEKVAEVSRPFMEKLVGAVGETVLVTVLLGHKRRTVIAMESAELLRVAVQLGEDERLYDTATGRQMLAQLSRERLKPVVEALGAPGKLWPEAGTVAGLHAALAEIEAKGYVEYHVAQQGRVTALAVPLRLRGAVPSAVGMFYPHERHAGEADTARFLEHLHDVAMRIEEAWSIRYGRKNFGQ